MISDHVVLLVFALVTIISAVGGLLILGGMLRESLRISRALGALIIQETNKLPGKRP